MEYLKLCEVYEELEKNPSRLKKIEILSDFLKIIKKEKNKEIVYLLKGKVYPDYSEKEFGISEKLVIKALSKASGVSTNDIVQKWKKIGDLGLVAQNIISTKKQNTLFSNKLTVEKIMTNLQSLPALEGKGTVGKKMNIISELLTSSKGIEAKYIIRTLLRDLRIGVANGTLRDAIRKACFDETEPEKIKELNELIQEAYDRTNDFAFVFEKACLGRKELESIEITPKKHSKVMLYQKEKTVEDGFERVGKPALIDYKYDGFRVMINKENSNIKIYTRRLDDVTKQFPEVIKYVTKYIKGYSFILDAEAVGFDPTTKKYRPFQEISQRIKRKYDIEKLSKKLPIEINVFDILYYNGKSLIKTPLSERRKLIEKIVPIKKFIIKQSEAIITDNIKIAEKFYKKALSEGEEGVMMKNLSSPYKPGSRVGHGIKIKPVENEFDLVIVGAEYGTGKRAGWLTSFDLSCKDENNALLRIGKASTGLKEKREQGLSYIELTDILKKLIIKEEGRKVEVKPKVIVTIIYQNIQISPHYDSGYALRFPRITQLRPDKSIQDVATLKEIEYDYKKNN